MATVAMVMEGLCQLKASLDSGEEPYNPWYCHMGLWVFRKPATPGGQWKVQFVVSGLPVDHPDHAERQYKRRINGEPRLGPQNKSADEITELFQNRMNLSQEEWSRSVNEVIPEEYEECVVCDDWSGHDCGGEHLWDLIGWDVVINSRGC